MNPLEVSLIIMGCIVIYFFAGYATFYQFNKRGDSFDTPFHVLAGMGWPLVLLVIVCGVMPVMAIARGHRKFQRRLKTKVSVQEVK